MEMTVERFSQMLADAPINDRFCFAVRAGNGAPHFFRIQKLRLADCEDFVLFAITDDGGLRDRIYNLYRYLSPVETWNRAAAVAHILWNYLNDYNEDMSIKPPLNLREERDGHVKSENEREAFSTFLKRELMKIERY